MPLIGDDGVEDHRGIEVRDESGRGPVAKPPGGSGGHRGAARAPHRARGHDLDPSVMAVGIETDRCPWVQALTASGYQV